MVVRRNLILELIASSELENPSLDLSLRGIGNCLGRFLRGLIGRDFDLPDLPFSLLMSAEGLPVPAVHRGRTNAVGLKRERRDRLRWLLPLWREHGTCLGVRYTLVRAPRQWFTTDLRTRVLMHTTHRQGPCWPVRARARARTRAHAEAPAVAMARRRLRLHI